MWNPQYLETANQGLIVRKHTVAASSSDGTNQNIDDTAFDAAIATEVEEPRSFDVVAGGDILIRKGVENLLGFREL
jgi:hypothetical protein